MLIDRGGAEVGGEERPKWKQRGEGGALPL